VSMNPLLDFSGLPRFADIRPEHVAPAIDQLLSENQALIDRLGADAQSPTWENFVAPLDDANERLARAWGQVAHLNAVMNTAQLREVYNATLPKISQYFAGLSQNEQLYARYKALHGAPGFAAASGAVRARRPGEARPSPLSRPLRSGCPSLCGGSARAAIT